MPFGPYSNGFGGLQPGPSTPDRANGSVAAPESELSTLYKRFERLQDHELEKNQFINELLTRVEFLTQQCDTLNAERQQERQYMAVWQQEKVQVEKYCKNLQRAMTDNPFVMVLIDGDGMIFTDDYLRQGEAGGRRAASQLYAAVQEYIETDTTDIPINSRIICRIYANVSGLADVLTRKGLVEDVAAFQDFVRGFTRGKVHFDFVDVGAGKDRADEKIIETFKLFSQDFHCRRLLFGCSHDNGYARSLEQCADRPEIVSKVVLVEGVPFEKELVPLPYTTKKFPGLFRESKIVLNGAAGVYNYAPPLATNPISPSSGPKSYGIFSGLPTRFPAPTRPTGLMDSPLPSRAALATSNMPRTPSSSTLASDGGSQVKPSVTWAAKAAAAAPAAPTVSPPYRPPIRHESISRNKAGQRVDPPCKDYDKAEVDRVKRMKLCNVHFLRNECDWVEGCAHEHAANPSREELATLRLVARMAPCSNGSSCRDIRCIYGHRCPAPPHRTNHRKGTKSCIFGEDCRFPVELHDIDTSVVKTLVVR